MRVYNGTENILAHPVRPAVTVGSFDGLHYGHRTLLAELKRRASEIGGQSVVVTFSPHPRCVLSRGGDIKLLNTLDEKVYLLEEIGIDVLVVLPFTAGFASLSSEEFVRKVLCGGVGMKSMIIGYDHRFGHDGCGGGSFLQNLGDELGFDIKRVERQDVGELKVSSTIVRDAIQKGDMKSASQYLTRPYIVLATLNEGFLTVDNPAKLLPPAGEYDVRVSEWGNIERTTNRLVVSQQGAMSLVDMAGKTDIKTVRQALVEFV